MNSKDYEGAAECFEKAGSFSDATTKLATCRFITAEAFYADGSLNTAKKIYEKLPATFSYNGVTVAERLDTLEKFKAYLPLCGTWSASDSSNTIKTIRSGSRYYWSRKPGSSQGEITIKCIINDDGTVTIRGSVRFQRYTNFSDVSYLLTSKDEVISINETVKKANFSIKIGDLTLGHNAKGYRARWQIKVKDGSSTNTYSADYLFDKMTSLY